MDTQDSFSGALDSNLGLYDADSSNFEARLAASDSMDVEPQAPSTSVRIHTTFGAEEEEEPALDQEEEEEDDVEEDDLSLLLRAWVNERSSPEILEYEGATLENLMELVDFQTQKMATQQAALANILKMDVDRVKYLVRSYLRTRLSKIEEHARHYVKDTMYRERLSQNELEYAKGYVELEERHVRRSFLDQLPPHLRGLEDVAAEGLEMVSKPDLDAAVFCRVRTTVGEFQFEPSEAPIVMRRNNIFITRYSIIRNLLEDDKVELI
ncbi:GINS complex subunit [Coemansia sp. RSA 2050]|nr:GINS complex subunit [Coemansia sp. RSA 2050]KAJ2730724.1 GINS complex subunit [Coemansia sp. BCRC 34962]